MSSTTVTGRFLGDQSFYPGCPVRALGTELLKMAADYQQLWNLRVACALLSLDAIEPFLLVIGFRQDRAPTLRAICREYLAAWEQRGDVGEESEAGRLRSSAELWLDRVARDQGQTVAIDIVHLADSLSSRATTPERPGWTELMARLAREPAIVPPQLPPAKFEVFKRISNRHLESMKLVHKRTEEFAGSLTSAWDMSLVQGEFFPDGDEDEESSQFDPETWLWDLLSDIQWRSFSAELHQNLTAAEIDLLVSWAKGLPDSTFVKHITTAI
jgi:hypothetical protein